MYLLQYLIFRYIVFIYELDIGYISINPLSLYKCHDDCQITFIISSHFMILYLTIFYDIKSVRYPNLLLDRLNILYSQVNFVQQYIKLTLIKRYIIIPICGKEKVNLHLRFLSPRISLILFFLLVISISLSHNIPYNILQKALAQTKKRIDNIDATSLDKTGENNNPANFATYKNSAFGITIQYPFNWEKMEEDEDQDSSEKQVVKFVPTVKDPLTKYSSFIISIHNMHRNNIKDFFKLFDKPTSDAISLRGFVLSHLTSLSTKLLDFKFIKPESYQTTLAENNLAQKIVYTYKEGTGDDAITAKAMEVLMVNDDKGYIISYHADSSNYLYYLPTVQKMINSFELTK